MKKLILTLGLIALAGCSSNVSKEKISAVDGLLLLDESGLLDQVELYINSAQASRAEKIIYQREIYWYRNDALVKGLGSMLGLTEDQIDDMFISATDNSK